MNKWFKVMIAAAGAFAMATVADQVHGPMLSACLSCGWMIALAAGISFMIYGDR